MKNFEILFFEFFNGLWVGLSWRFGLFMDGFLDRDLGKLGVAIKVAQLCENFGGWVFFKNSHSCAIIVFFKFVDIIDVHIGLFWVFAEGFEAWAAGIDFAFEEAVELADAGGVAHFS